MTKKIMTHMVCGYPNMEESHNIYRTLSKYSTYIEVQFPFSDPIADGPIISQANREALHNGTDTWKCFDFLEAIHAWNASQSKTIIMTYYHIVHFYGVEKFIERASNIGIFWVIIPDIPFDSEEGKVFIELCKDSSINFIPVVSSNISEERLMLLANSISTSLVYAVSQNMTTWNDLHLSEKFPAYIKRVRSLFHDSKIAVWFGIKTEKDIENVLQEADIAVLGSILLKIYNTSQTKGLDAFLKNLFQNKFDK